MDNLLYSYMLVWYYGGVNMNITMKNKRTYMKYKTIRTNIPTIETIYKELGI